MAPVNARQPLNSPVFSLYWSLVQAPMPLQAINTLISEQLGAHEAALSHRMSQDMKQLGLLHATARQSITLITLAQCLDQDTSLLQLLEQVEPPPSDSLAWRLQQRLLAQPECLVAEDVHYPQRVRDRLALIVRWSRRQLH